MLKLLISLVLVAFSLNAYAQPAQSAIPAKADSVAAPPKAVKSPRLKTEGSIGGVKIFIDYSSPSVRGRTIWGGLVGYDAVWVTGGHNATSVEFSKDVTIGDKTVKAGIYALFTIPNKTEWTVILNKNFDQHLADDYDVKLDVVRVKVVPKILDAVQESLVFDVKETNKKDGVISMRWEKLEITLAVTTL